jgi:hypothetical protein
MGDNGPTLDDVKVNGLGGNGGGELCDDLRSEAAILELLEAVKGDVTGEESILGGNGGGGGTGCDNTASGEFMGVRPDTEASKLRSILAVEIRKGTAGNPNP